jgi:tRNA-modifying protein YgfZ
MLNYCKIKLDFLKFTGNDRLDLINRLSTNFVNSVGKLKGIKTILTSDKGRFIDLLTLYNFGDFVFATCSFNNSEKVTGHLDKYTIMDDFKAIDMAGTHEAVLFIGNKTGDYAKEVFGTDFTKFSNNDFAVFSEENRDSIIAKNDNAFGGFIFIYAAEDSGFYTKKLFSPFYKEKYLLEELTAAGFEKQRIEYGIPKAGREMTEETNPLECGLEKYVSFTKGCYIGQEVIARLDTYDKISKHLVGLKLEGNLPSNYKPGLINIRVDNKECGYVTSSVYSEKFGNIGLGFVKTALLDYSKAYEIKTEGSIKCRIVKLPFTNSINTTEH